MDTLGRHNSVAEEENTDQMPVIKMRLKAIMAIFGLANILRSVSDVLIGIYLVQYVTYATEYPALHQFCKLIYFIFVDMLPIGLIFRFHHANFKIEEDDQRQVRINVNNEDIARARQN